MRLKTKIIHKLEFVNFEPHYKCNHAVGKLTLKQAILKSSLMDCLVTCKNCRGSK